MKYSKAIAAFLGSFVPALTVPLIAGHWPTQPDVITAIGLALAATTAVYFAPKNADA